MYVVGAVLELGGILLVAWPDVLPYAGSASRWLRLTSRRAINRLRVALGRPRHYDIHAGAGSFHAKASLSGSAVVSISPAATLEERVDFLLRREEAAQEKLNAHDKRLSAIEDSLPRQLDELRAETERHVSEEISAAEWRYRPLRFVGALALAFGLALTTTANFL